jgi:hypothetical protein
MCKNSQPSKISCIQCTDGKSEYQYTKKMKSLKLDGNSTSEINIYKCECCKRITWRFTDLDSNVSRETLKTKTGAKYEN